MKTAISIPDEVFQAAERAAQRLSVSRSELYTCAVRKLLDELSDEAVTLALDAVYSEVDSSLDPALKRAQRKALGAGPW